MNLTWPARMRSNSGGLLRVRVRVADVGDLLRRHAAIHQTPLDLVVDGKAPACRVHAHIAEDHLRAPDIRGPAPYLGGFVEHGGQLGIRLLHGIRADQAGVEGELPAVSGDRQRVVVFRADAALPDTLVAGDQAGLDLDLLVRHRAGYDRRLAALERRDRQFQHVRRLHVRERAEHLLQLGQVHELGEPGVRAQAKTRPG